MAPPHNKRGVAREVDIADCSDEVLLVRLLKDDVPRFHEAVWLLERHEAALCAAEERALLDVCRQDDDRLERAIEHRDEMRRHLAVYQLRSSAIEFTRSAPLVPYIPSLRVLPLLSRLGHRLLLLIKGLGGPAKVLSALANLRTVLDALRPACRLAVEATMASAKTPSEALLLSSLTDASCGALVLHLCRNAGSARQQLRRSEAAPRSGIHAPPATSESLAALSSLCVEVTEAMVAATLHVARSIATTRVDDEVRAHVSLAIAEMLSLFDRIAPKRATASDRRVATVCSASFSAPSPSSVCPLSGLKRSLTGTVVGEQETLFGLRGVSRGVAAYARMTVTQRPVAATETVVSTPGAGGSKGPGPTSNVGEVLISGLVS